MDRVRVNTDKQVLCDNNSIMSGAIINGTKIEPGDYNTRFFVKKLKEDDETKKYEVILPGAEKTYMTAEEIDFLLRRWEEIVEQKKMSPNSWENLII